MHPTVVVARVSKHGQDERLPWKRFEVECKLLCSLHHSNIVQYLDTKLDPDSKQPVLLMELMDESLTRFLDNCKTNLPFHTEVNICHDSALVMSFLHSNDIVHRDFLMIESTCITVEGNIGEDGKPTTAVYMYREDLKGKPGWTKVGYMTTPRCRCFAIAYNPKKLLVIGGLTNSGKTSSMETTEFF